VRVVARIVKASDELIEDACQAAWALLLRHHPSAGRSSPGCGSWRCTSAYRLCCAEQRHTHLEDIDHDGGWETLIAGATVIDDVIEARPALELLPAQYWAPDFTRPRVPIQRRLASTVPRSRNAPRSAAIRPTRCVAARRRNSPGTRAAPRCQRLPRSGARS
jgi:hypothetical protein